MVKFVELTKELTLNKVYKENIIKNSLYKSAIEKNRSKYNSTICTNLWIPSWLPKDIKKNDSFQIVYEEYKNDENKIVDFGNILYANLILQGKSIELYYFKSEKEKINDHFDSRGQSIKKH